MDYIAKSDTASTSELCGVINNVSASLMAVTGNKGMVAPTPSNNYVDFQAR